jgi:hypothetical protein
MYLIIISIAIIFIIRYIYKIYCIRLNFNRLDTYFPRTLKWENDLKIYKNAMPIFKTNHKKKRCLLLIGGYKDIPYVWDELIRYLDILKIDYYAPRTFGTGRTFFQDSTPADWTITYLEAIKILENQYEIIDIMALSAGCIIALYLSEFNYKCKINNIILCAPYLLEKPSLLTDLIFSSNISFFLDNLIRIIMPYRIKTRTNGMHCVRNIYDENNAKLDFYDIVSYYETDRLLFKFKDIRLSQINANNIIILFTPNDHVIGDIYKQKNIIEMIYNKNIKMIQIPSKENILCGHVMIKESSQIIIDIIHNIKDYLIL